MRICQEHGLNHIRFHSHCPPEAAFVAADEMGIYLQVECGVWANWTASIGNGEPVDDFLYREAGRIIAEYGNHPSFLLMAHGNEPAGPKEGAEYLTKWIDHFRKRDGRRLYTGGSGWPMIPAIPQL
jgi:beta-galactosidase/beta-glucuronidase